MSIYFDCLKFQGKLLLVLSESGDEHFEPVILIFDVSELANEIFPGLLDFVIVVILLSSPLDHSAFFAVVAGHTCVAIHFFDYSQKLLVIDLSLVEHVLLNCVEILEVLVVLGIFALVKPVVGKEAV